MHEEPHVDAGVRWFDSDYRSQFSAAGLRVVEKHLTFGRDGEPVEWVMEKEVAPWVVYVVESAP